MVDQNDNQVTHQLKGAESSFSELLKTIAQLRDPIHGCPWDIEQTSKSLLPYLMEEAQEFMSVIENQQDHLIKEELGDVLFQVVLHAQIAFEKKLFTMEQMCQALNTKLIERHPHVFKENQNNLTAAEVKELWNKNKIKKDGLQKLHDAMKLPPILSADKIGSFSHGVGFDWNNSKEVLEKVKEEVQEVQEVLEVEKKSTPNDHLAEEIGDLLFSTIQLARHSQLSADYCLKLANQKFYNRFLKLDKLVKSQNKNLLQMSLEEKEALWKQVKQSDQKS
jgi:ATP diphosphatase